MTGRRIWLAGLALAAALAWVETAAADELARAGRVANTDGEALRLRAAPSSAAPILKRLGPGWRLTVLGAPSSDGHWLKVEHAGTVGYVAVGFVALDEVDEAPPPAPAGPARPGRVVNTDGANLRLRAAPEATAEVVKALGPGWRLTVLGEPVADGRWLRVEHGGTVGYVDAGYVAAGEAEEAALPPSPASGQPRAGWVANTDGAMLRLRATPQVEAAIVKRLAPGWRVTILEGPFTAADGAPWVRVEHAGQTGYAAAAYIAGSAAGGGDAGPAPDARPPAPADPRPLMTTEAARLRTAPSLSGTIITRLMAGTAVEGLGREASGDGYRWAWVRVYGREGWVVAGALAPAPGRDTGRRLANEALSQVGRPYVWGGETPAAGFDCSGLVRYVVQRVTGIDLTHVLSRQAEAGSPVDRDGLEAGDLVFFENTYKPGLSHVGFYVGQGEFVAAQGERAGVARAPLDAPYWRVRFYGARRLSE